MHKKTILVVDDDETIRAIVEEALKQGGFNVLTAPNGEDGLAIAQQTPLDGILLDRKMPGMDGDEVLDELKIESNTKDIPVMMLTAKHAINDVTDCLERGASDYVVKPTETENLVTRVNNMLRS